jgi:hypothetical protein
METLNCESSRTKILLVSIAGTLIPSIAGRQKKLSLELRCRLELEKPDARIFVERLKTRDYRVVVAGSFVFVELLKTRELFSFSFVFKD